MKKSLIIVLSLAFGLTKSHSQQRKRDSLMKIYHQETDDSLKIATLATLFNLELYTNPKEAKSIAEQILETSNRQDYTYGSMLGNYYLGNYYLIQTQIDEAEPYYGKARSIAENLGLTAQRANALSGLAKVAMARGEYSRALALEDSVAGIYLNEKDFLRYGVTLGNIAANHLRKGNFSKAMQGYLNALKVLDTVSEEPFRKADILRDLGKLHIQQDNLERSIAFFLEALEVYESISDHLYSAYTLMDIGNAYMQQPDYDQAIAYYQKSMAISEKYHFPDNTSIGYLNMGMAHKEKGAYNRAVENLLKGLNRTEGQLSSINRIISLYQMGHTYTLLNQLDTALDYLDRSVALAQTSNTHNELKFALEHRAIAHEKQGQLALALQDLKRYQMIKDSLFTMEKTKQIEELQTKYETEKKEAEIALQAKEIKNLNQEVEIGNLKKGLYAGGMISFVVISGLLFFGFRQRMKKNRIAREKQEEIYRQEIEYKKKELASQTLHLVQKNTFIQEMRENLEKIKNSPELFKIEFRRLTMLLKRQSAEDKDWEVFKSYFADVHDNFDNTLRALHKNITDKEIKLAAFLRMDLSTKEISAMLNVIPTSILTSKYRLKKKLGLEKETDLGSFLKSL